MAEANWSGSTDRDDGADERVARRRQMAQALARGGMENVHVLSHESAETVLTPKRREIIGELRQHDVDSVRELARRLDRDKGDVSRDLATLATHGVIKYDEDGRAKRPYLDQDHIVVEPI